MNTFSITILSAAILLLLLWYSFSNKEVEIDLPAEEEDKYTIARRIELAAKAEYIKALSNPAEWTILNYYSEGYSIEDGVIVDYDYLNKHALILDAYKTKICQQGWIDLEGKVQHKWEEETTVNIYNALTSIVLYIEWTDGCTVVGKSLRSNGYGPVYEMYYKRNGV